MTKATSVVVDLDGTLCNSLHRSHWAELRQWDEFHSRMMDDLPHDDVARLVSLCHASGLQTIGCTGRPERWRQQTYHWLRQHEIPLDVLLMRGNHDYASDAELKPRILEEWHATTDQAELMTVHERVLFVLDDRESVVEAWRENGYSCWQVRLGIA